MTRARVSVIIAAHDCAPTLGRAIGSALAQPETAEVIVADDASTDDTRAHAADWTRRDARVRLVALDQNLGPAGARNRAIAVATGDVIAILDSDDFFAPGRLGRLLAEPGWDMIADNVVFMTETAAETASFAAPAGAPDRFTTIDAARFALGNLSDGRQARREMGFLKPLMARRFLQDNGLAYDTTLRLGEDFDLYMRMLLAGARFRLTLRPGYGAVVRGGSLSARHSTADLAALDAALAGHLALAGPDPSAIAAMRAHRREVRARLDHRRFLDRKAEAGLSAAIRYALEERGRLSPILGRVLRDKLGLAPTAARPLGNGGQRLLIPLGG